MSTRFRCRLTPERISASVKTAIHRKLIQKLNLDRLSDVKREDVRREVSQILETLVTGELLR